MGLLFQLYNIYLHTILITRLTIVDKLLNKQFLF